MKIDCDKDLYVEIAKFPINEIRQVSNRKGHKRTIHITNITKLSWSDLQRLVDEGVDKFTKMVLLYRAYKDEQADTDIAIKGEGLTDDELREIDEYIKLYKENNCKEHYEVNQIVSNKGEWDKFKNIRSLNDHGPHKEIPGIQPKYYNIICDLLNISGCQGLPLDSYKKY